MIASYVDQLVSELLGQAADDEHLTVMLALVDLSERPAAAVEQPSVSEVAGAAGW